MKEEEVWQVVGIREDDDDWTNLGIYSKKEDAFIKAETVEESGEFIKSSIAVMPTTMRAFVDDVTKERLAALADLFTVTEKT